MTRASNGIIQNVEYTKTKAAKQRTTIAIKRELIANGVILLNPWTELSKTAKPPIAMLRALSKNTIWKLHSVIVNVVILIIVVDYTLILTYIELRALFGPLTCLYENNNKPWTLQPEPISSILISKWRIVRSAKNKYESYLTEVFSLDIPI